jgi:hypothetical protein
MIADYVGLLYMAKVTSPCPLETGELTERHAIIQKKDPKYGKE